MPLDDVPTPTERFFGTGRRELNKKLGFDRYEGMSEDEDHKRLDLFWEWITSGPHVEIPGPADLVAEAKYFRGQSRSEFGFTTTLYRLCKRQLGAEGKVTEQHLADAEAAIIDALRAEGMGRRMTNGELLMVCQHHGVPTRLIDVSEMPLEALFFAVEKEDQSDGRLFIVAPHRSTRLPHHAAPLKLGGDPLKERSLPWEGVVYGNTRALGTWTNAVRLVKEAPLDPRMRAQAGNFLVGGLHRYYSGLTLSGLDSDDRPDVTNFAINFAANTGPNAINSNWSASGWTVRIPAQWKSELRQRLAQLNEYMDRPIEKIAFDWMYPPVTEITRLATHVAKKATEQVHE